jgi:NADH-ubiquinone oxidoreductase chain 3
MNRIEFNISFYIFGLLFLLFDLEILLVYPYTVSNSNNSVYGGLVAIIFLLLLTVGFCYEVGHRALQINSRQSGHLSASTTTTTTSGPAPAPAPAAAGAGAGGGAGGGAG